LRLDILKQMCYLVEIKLTAKFRTICIKAVIIIVLTKLVLAVTGDPL